MENERGQPPMDNTFHGSCEKRIADLEDQLAAMTEDRDLWQGQHNDDCPNEAETQRLRDVLRKARGWIGAHDAPSAAYSPLLHEIDDLLRGDDE